MLFAGCLNLTFRLFLDSNFWPNVDYEFVPTRNNLEICNVNIKVGMKYEWK